MKNILILLISINLYAVNINQVFNKKVIHVKKEDIIEKETYFGKIKINEENVYEVRLRYDGFVDGINKNKTYQKVNKGDILFKIYSEEGNKTLNEYKLTKSKASLKKLKNLEIESNTKGNINVKSKYTGIILEKNINENSYIKKGNLLYKIVDLSSVWIDIDFFQKDLNKIKLNQEVEIIIDNNILKGKIDFIYPILENKKGKFRVVINSENLYPGSFVKANVIFNKESKLVLPESAIISKRNKKYVFKVEGKDVYPLEITAKKVSNKFEILSGLDENEKVIDNALFLLDSDAMMNKLYETEDEEW